MADRRLKAMVGFWLLAAGLAIACGVSFLIGGQSAPGETYRTATAIFFFAAIVVPDLQATTDPGIRSFATWIAAFMAMAGLSVPRLVHLR